MNIYAKRGLSRKNLYALERAWPTVYCVDISKSEVFCLCSSVKVTSPLHVGKFPSKYSGSINSLISKIIIFENGQFGQLLTYKQISILSSFMREYLCEKGNFPAYWVRIRKGVVKCWLCTSIEVTRPLYAEEFPSEYLDNRKTLMRKTVHFENGQFGQFQTHQQIPIVSIFMREYLRGKGEFLTNCVHVRKGVVKCLLYASAEVLKFTRREAPFWIFKQ